MKSKSLEHVLANTPKDIELFTDLYADLLVRINEILREKGITQKALAAKLEKQPSEISKWLNGNHNFTLRSIARLSAELGEPLLEVPRVKSTTFRVVKPIRQDSFGGDYQNDTKLIYLRPHIGQVNESQHRYGS